MGSFFGSTRFSSSSGSLCHSASARHRTQINRPRWPETRRRSNHCGNLLWTRAGKSHKERGLHLGRGEGGGARGSEKRGCTRKEAREPFSCRAPLRSRCLIGQLCRRKKERRQRCCCWPVARLPRHRYERTDVDVDSTDGSAAGLGEDKKVMQKIACAEKLVIQRFLFPSVRYLNCWISLARPEPTIPPARATQCGPVYAAA
jgi:hypothetical protein